MKLRRPFLTATEREQFAAALDEARRHTRARIGLSIDERASRDPSARAHALFRQWDLPEYERSTAVLVYVCASSRTFAIIGGDEVRRVTPRSFWDVVDRDLHHHFDEGRYCDGIFKAIAQVAVQLECHFPRDAEETVQDPPANIENQSRNPSPTDPARQRKEGETKGQEKQRGP